MIKKLIFLMLLLASAQSLYAVEAVEFELGVYQYDKTSGENKIVFLDSTSLETGKTITGFIGPLSFDLELLQADTVNCQFNMHLVTLGASANTYSKSFIVEYSLPARFDDIRSKNDTRYSFIIKPIEKKEINTSNCTYDHRSKKDFTFKPTAHTDIYYIQTSLGDFYWDSIKEIMEANYRKFKDFMKLNIPGKTTIYIAPCPINTVLWDKRFGTAVDPTRNLAFAVYNREFNTADPFILNHAVALRTYGYSAPFLSEGLANYFSFAIYDMKKLAAEKNLIPLSKFTQTHDYYLADPSIADRTSTTFVQYLINKYSISKFMELYRLTDDLNLAETIPAVYDKSLDELEIEWLTFVDSFTITPTMLYTFSSQAEMMLNYHLAHKYNVQLLEMAKDQPDSIRALNLLKRSSFFTGNYYDAADYQAEALKYQPNDAVGWMARGSYTMMNGIYEKAYEYFQKGLSIDSSNEMIKFNIALYNMNIGEMNKAKELLMTNFSNAKNAGAQGESRIYLANLLAASKDKNSQEQAARYYQEAATMYEQLLQTNSSTSTVYLFLGAAYLGLFEYDKAVNYLHVAEFIETRPFYSGMINLLLGKAYIAAGDIESAKEYLAKVISEPSAVYHQNEAKKLLTEFE